MAASVGGAGLIATGTYVGDGNATKSIIGIGFKPKHVMIIEQVADGTAHQGFKITQDGINSLATASFGAGGIATWTTDMIISLDVDGFTVGDGTGLSNAFNINAHSYSYIGFG